jgi:hypothetical protein
MQKYDKFLTKGGLYMDTAPYAEKMFALHKMTIERFNDGLDLVQAQTDKTLDLLLDQTDWMPEVYKAPVKKWQGVSARQFYRTTAFMKGLCSSYEPLFVRPKKKAAGKTQTTRKNEPVNRQKMEGENES